VADVEPHARERRVWGDRSGHARPRWPAPPAEASSDSDDAAAPRLRSSSRAMVNRVIVAAPRGFCAGVVRAVDTVREALEAHGPPVYVRKHIVHNAHVVRELQALG